MNDNRGQTIFLSVIGIATLLVAIIGATFAYFTTQMDSNSTQGDVTATTAKLGTVRYDATSITATNTVLPGWSEDGTVTLTLGQGDVDVEYDCYINVTTLGDDGTDLADMYVTTTAGSVTPTGASHTLTGLVTKKALTSDKIKIASGKLVHNASGDATQVINYTVGFSETGTNQNTQQGKSLVAAVSCELKSSNVYYNNENPGGTTTKPTAPTS